MRSKVYWVAALSLLAACSILGEDSAPTGTRTIVLYNFFYYPAQDTLTALEGDTITVTFQWSENAFNHSVTWDDTPIPGIRSSEVQSVGSFEATLIPGTYDYHCSTAEGIAANMIGRIVIKPHPME
jgi:plastocyanin